MPDYKSVMISSKKPNKNKKRKKENPFLAIVRGLVPWKGDSVGEIVRKIVFLVSIVVLCAAVLIIIDTYMFKPVREREEFNKNIMQLGNHEPTADDKLMLSFLYAKIIPFTVVANKADKLSRAQIEKAIGVISTAYKCGRGDIIAVSSKSGYGLEKVKSAIDEVISLSEQPMQEDDDED